LKAWLDLQGNNAVTAENLSPGPRHSPNSGCIRAPPLPRGSFLAWFGGPIATLGTVLSTRLLTKRYGSLTAVEDLDLEVGAGELFGFLGPNGAGKTTTIKMLV